MENDDKWKIDMLRKLWSGEDSDPEKDREKKSASGSPASKKGQSRPSIDLHGFHELTVQLSEAEKAIDRAITDGHSGIIIIHGKGEGILRSQLIKELERHQHVAEITSDTNAFGESGQLTVTFK